MRSYYLAALLAVSSYSVSAQKHEASDDTPEDIAKDAARDLKDSRFYNRPGATRADYDRDWQDCRLIARGSRTPGGQRTLYNPALFNPAISPLAGAIGGGLGALIGAAIVEGQQRRENRRTCLLIRGWRMVEPPQQQSAAILAMGDAERDAYFNRVVGAQTVEGTVTTLDKFEPVAGLPGSMGGAPAAAPTLVLGKKVAADAPVELAADEGAVMIVFRRNDTGSAGRSGALDLGRYDAAAGDLQYQPRKWKKLGDFKTYWTSVSSQDRKAAYEIQIVKLTAGDYVVASDTVGKAVATKTYCFGAPTFRVMPGRITYLTDVIPFMAATGPDGAKISGLGYARDFAVARASLGKLRPDLVDRLVDGEIRNGATYSCSGAVMTRMDYPGAAMIAPATGDTAPPVPIASAAMTTQGN